MDSMEIDEMNKTKNSRYISQKVRKQILEKQNYKCGNIYGINNYYCKLWKYENGNFDEAGYEFDHIEEYCLTQNNSINNIQALCPSCHKVKTKIFIKQKGLYSSIEISNGMSIMEI